MNSKLNIRGGALIIAGANLLIFLSIFIPLYVTSEAGSVYYYIYKYGENAGLFYLVSYLDEILRWITPTFAAVLLIQSYAAFGKKGLFKNALMLSAANITYTLPFYYLYTIDGGAYTGEAIIYALIISAAYIMAFFLYCLLEFWIIRKCVCHFSAIRDAAALPPLQKENEKKLLLKKAIKAADENLAQNMKDSRAFDFSHPATLGIFFASLCSFALYFAKEIISTVSFLNEYKGTYRTGEIVYISFRFIFILIMLFTTHLVCHKAKNKAEYFPANEENL